MVQNDDGIDLRTPAVATRSNPVATVWHQKCSDYSVHLKEMARAIDTLRKGGTASLPFVALGVDSLVTSRAKFADVDERAVGATDGGRHPDNRRSPPSRV